MNPRPGAEADTLPCVELSTVCIFYLVSADRAMGRYITHESGLALEEQDHLHHSTTKKRKTDETKTQKKMPRACVSGLVSTDNFTAADLSQNLALLVT